jgi:uncharacterized protein
MQPTNTTTCDSHGKLRDKQHALRQYIRDAVGDGRALAAFSGGVDSSLLLLETVRALGANRVTAVTVVGPTSADGEEESARAFCETIGIELITTTALEMDDPRFVENDENRCYVCKRIRYDALFELAATRGATAVLDGTQADDRPEDRPGMKALRETGALTPLAAVGIGKEEVRQLLHDAGYEELARRPARPCLATRIPHGTPVTIEALDRIRAGEKLLHDLGFKLFRLRDHFPLARIVTDTTGCTLLMSDSAIRQRAVEGLQEFGYTFVTLDLLPYGRSGTSRPASGGSRLNSGSESVTVRREPEGQKSSGKAV